MHAQWRSDAALEARFMRSAILRISECLFISASPVAQAPWQSVDFPKHDLTIPLGSALRKVQSNKVYLPPTLWAGVTSLGGAADKRYSLGLFLMTICSVCSTALKLHPAASGRGIYVDSFTPCYAASGAKLNPKGLKKLDSLK